MRVVLFDLGNTLIDNHHNLLPGAEEMLNAAQLLQDPDGQLVKLALVSDFTSPATPEQVEPIRQQYYSILRGTNLAKFFDPLPVRVTLSTEVGVGEPDRRIFRAALDKIDSSLHFHHAIFIEENPAHVAGARRLGMMAIHFKGPGQSHGEVEKLVDLIPLIKRMVAFSPCCKKRSEAVGR